jgi:lipoprotein-anchoring transpeptidase ErfK/SrfK
MWYLRNSCQKNVLSKNFFVVGRPSAGNLPEPSNKQGQRSTPLMAQVQGRGGTLMPCCLIRGVVFSFIGLLLAGCLQSGTLAPSDANFTGRDRQQLANPPYQRASISPTYQRQIVQYHRREGPGSVVVDTAGPFVYYVLPGGKAIRYGATVGEAGQAWSGVATVGRKAEWPGWTPTADEKRRLGPLPSYVRGGAHNPMGARALYLYAGGKDTLYRIHGTNQPEYIGSAISSGCIRITNEDVIDLYGRVKIGATVVVL